MTGQFDRELSAHLDNLNHELEEAVRRTVELHRAGADEEAVLAETSLAFRSARALEALTGVAWEERLEAKADAGDLAEPNSEAVPTKRRWGRKRARSVDS